MDHIRTWSGRHAGLLLRNQGTGNAIHLPLKHTCYNLACVLPIRVHFGRPAFEEQAEVGDTEGLSLERGEDVLAGVKYHSVSSRNNLNQVQRAGAGATLL